MYCYFKLVVISFMRYHLQELQELQDSDLEISLDQLQDKQHLHPINIIKRASLIKRKEDIVSLQDLNQEEYSTRMQVLLQVQVIINLNNRDYKGVFHTVLVKQLVFSIMTMFICNNLESWSRQIRYISINNQRWDILLIEVQKLSMWSNRQCQEME